MGMRDKDYLEGEVATLRDKVSSLQKEIKEIQGQEKKSINEYSDLNDKLAEVCLIFFFLCFGSYFTFLNPLRAGR